MRARVSSVLIVFLFTAVCLSPSGAIAQQKETPAPESQGDKASYALGAQIGGGMKARGVELSVEQFVAGLRDAFDGRALKLTEEEMTAAMQKFQAEQQEKAGKLAAELGAKNAMDAEEFLAKNAKKEGVSVTGSGLQFEVLSKGDGDKPKETDTVKVHYHGTLIDGTVFDSSVERGEPASFPVNQVIPGWTEALQLMPVGSKWRIVLPSKLAYGERGAGPRIGPNSTLVFEVELLGIE